MQGPVIYRYESVLKPEAGGGMMSATVLSKEPLDKGTRVKISRTWWVTRLAIPADDQRPHLGDKIAISIKQPKA